MKSDFLDPRLPERFWSKCIPEPMSGCWLWTASLDTNGYGRVKVPTGKADGRAVPSHRWSYEALVGPIPRGLHIDHLCRVRCCVNPAHLEPVTVRENVLRSPVAPAAVNAMKTSCPNGHAYSGRNIDGGRICRACVRLRYRARSV